MSGVKGRSGRPTNYQTVDFNKLIEKSFSIQMGFFDDPNVDQERKVEYASRYLSKRVGEKIDLAVEHVLNADQMNALLSKITQRYINA